MELLYPSKYLQVLTANYRTFVYHSILGNALNEPEETGNLIRFFKDGKTLSDAQNVFGMYLHVDTTVHKLTAKNLLVQKDFNAEESGCEFQKNIIEEELAKCNAALSVGASTLAEY